MKGSARHDSVTAIAEAMTSRRLVATVVDQRSGRGLGEQADDARDGHDETDGRLVPALLRAAHGDQIDREIGPQPVAHVGEEEVQSVEPAQGLPGRRAFARFR